MKHFICVTALTWSFGVQAAFISGNDLLERMNGQSASTAIGYVMGVHDADDGIHFCTPARVTAGQMYDLVKIELEKMPALRHHPANLLVGAIFKKQWPCATAKNDGSKL